MRKSCVWLVMAAVLLACGGAFAMEMTPPVFEWERDLHKHWQLNESGLPVNSGEHTLDDAFVCTVCGSEIWDFGDGSGDVNNYDTLGNLLHYTGFGADGAILNDSRHRLTYNEDGIVVLDQEFIGGVLYGEYVYTADADGNQIPVTQTAYNEDGTVSTNWYDEYGNCVRAAIFDAEGKLDSEMLMEYAVSDEGWHYEAKTTVRFAQGECFYSEQNQYGDKIRAINTDADGTKWLDRVYEFEYADGMKRHMQAFENGVLVAETFYDEEGCNSKDIEYMEDGSCIVYTYDENGDTVETVYDAAGNLME